MILPPTRDASCVSFSLRIFVKKKNPRLREQAGVDARSCHQLELDDVSTPEGISIGQVDRDGQLVHRERSDGADVVGGPPEELEVLIATLDVVAEESQGQLVESDFLPKQDEIVDTILAGLVQVVGLPVDGAEVVAEAEVEVDEAEVLLGLDGGHFAGEVEALCDDLGQAEAEAEIEDADLGADGKGDLESRVDPGVDLDVVGDVGTDRGEDRGVGVEFDAAVLGRGGQGQ